MDDIYLLLSDEWLNDNHINFFSSLLNNVASHAGLPILITSIPFPTALKPFKEMGGTLKDISKVVLQQHIIKEVLKKVDGEMKLYTPYHLHDHWVVVCIDRGNRVVSYGEYKEYPTHKKQY